MNERKKSILRAIIDDYILTAIPVGSGTISKKYLLNLSSATIRNEMSDLEELGYLFQPHISAGRVPNARAYRMYVDSLMDEGLIDEGREEEVNRYFSSRLQQIEDVVSSAAQALSEFTQYTALVTAPKQDELRVSCLQLVPVSRNTALLVIVTDGGVIRDTLVRVSEGLDSDALYAISRMLTERLSGKSLREMQEILKRFASQSLAEPQVLQGIHDLAKQMQKQAESTVVAIAGTHHILDYPEYADVEKARRVLSILEEKDRLMDLIRESAGLQFSVLIGPETGVPEMRDCSLVLKSYNAGQEMQGLIGIVGPTRMPYQSVFAILNGMGKAISGVLNENETPS